MKKKVEGIVMGCMLLVLLLLLTELPIFQDRWGLLFIDSMNTDLSFDVWLNLASDNKAVFGEPIKITYQAKGIEGSYPQIVAGGTKKAMENWNLLIKTDFDKILQIYSFHPFAGPTPPSTDIEQTLLNIVYEIKSNNKEVFSVLYRADFNSSFVAHPSNLVYTTNLDKNRNKRLRLADIVILSEAFVKDFRTWEPIAYDQENKEMRKAAMDYIGNITDQDLLKGFRSSDRIGSGNPWGIYSYLTNNSLGISIEVPHYAGDQIQFEVPFSDLKKYLKDGYGS